MSECVVLVRDSFPDLGDKLWHFGCRKAWSRRKACNRVLILTFEESRKRLGGLRTVREERCENAFSWRLVGAWLGGSVGEALLCGRRCILGTKAAFYPSFL